MIIDTTPQAVAPALYVNPLVRVTFDGGLHLELPLEGRRFALDDPTWVTALGVLAHAADRADFCARLVAEGASPDDDHAAATADGLALAGVIVEGTQPQLWRTAELWVERGWTEALLFHLACHTDRFSDEGIDHVDTANDHVLAARAAGERPSVWHRYSGHVVELPAGREPGSLPDLETVLLRRRSNRPWRSGSATIEEVATMARLASRETVAVRRTFEREVDAHPAVILNSPFTGLELYLAVHNVEGIEPGLYHYEPDMHRLRVLRAADLTGDLQRMCVGQHRAGDGAGTWIVTGVWERFRWRYPHPSAYRTLIVNVGELAQKLIVLGTALGLSTFVSPAFDDQFADELLNLNPAMETPLEVVGFG